MKTVYPKDPIPTFNEWMQYINNEVKKNKYESKRHLLQRI